jgi:predicted TIM-barrel fold metal-dependent hydrolase
MDFAGAGSQNQPLMALIDFNSRPPIPAFDTAGAAHLRNYRTVYAASESQVREQQGEDRLASYLRDYDQVDARHVVVKAKDVETTFGLKVHNEAVAAFCKEQGGGRFIGWAGVDPHKGDAALQELEFAVRELGLRGLNLQGFEHRLAINDPLMMTLYRKCVELDIPVNIHCGINFSTDCLMEHGRPLLLDQVMVNLPALRVVASPPGWPWVHELLGVAWRHRNVHIAVSAIRPKLLTTPGSGYEGLLQYGNTLLQDRIFFGTSFPMQPIPRAVDEVLQLPLKDAIREKWLYANAARFLGVS